jgi:2'-5' RNA ligase
MKLATALFHLDAPARARVASLARMIPPADLADKAVGIPHVTAKFGIHSDDPHHVADVVRGFGPVPMILGRVSSFPAPEGKPFDVVKIDVGGDRLRQLNARLSALPHTDTHNEYKPHVTIAYVRPGLGAEYARRFAPLALPVVGRHLIFSDSERRSTRIPLGDAIEMADAPPSSEPLPTDEVAPAGADGKRLAELLQESKDRGTLVMEHLVRRAIRRLLMSGDPRNADAFFDADELATLQRTIANTTATADLLGRARVRERMAHIEGRRTGVLDFAESNAFVPFVNAPKPVPPLEAIDYFKALVPSLSPINPVLFGQAQERRAFTMAAKANTVLLDKVKQVILDRLTTGQAVNTAPATIQGLLDGAGVSVANPQYSEMVFRTNMMDAYNHGAMTELRDPEVADFFPAWQYLSIVDGRARPTHAAKNLLLYDNKMDFADVRGRDIADVANCRCSFRAIDRYELQDMQAKGATVQTA